MAEKGVSFVSKQTRIHEFYPAAQLKGKTFADIAEDLYVRLLKENKTIPALMQVRENEIPEEHRAGLVKFFYLSDGVEKPIPKSESVITFYMNTGVNQVLFFVDVIGGWPARAGMDSIAGDMERSEYDFLAHAQELLADPQKHGHWKLEEYAPHRFRLIKTVRDRCRRVITILLEPNAGYPRRPPRVATVPTHRDPCFSSGELDWTVIKGSDTYTWELYMEHANPLVYLLDELKTKYGLVF
jgi:hypothetical protein